MFIWIKIENKKKKEKENTNVSYEIMAVLNMLCIKAAESVSFCNYCMWIFLFYKKLHMSKLSIKVELIPQHKPFYEFRLLAFVRKKEEI